MANFSIDFLVGKKPEETERSSSTGHDNDDEVMERDDEEEEEEERPRSSAFVPATDKGVQSQSQSWHDVLMPHMQMASTNPFLMGLGSPNMTSGDGHLNGDLALHHQRQLQSTLWTQQWFELVHQATSQGRYLGVNEAQAGLFLQPFRKPKRIRTAFSPTQLLQLEHAFDNNHYVIGAERKQLAQRLQLTETQVKVWFQNRRTKHKRIKSEEEAKKNPRMSSPMQKITNNSNDSANSTHLIGPDSSNNYLGADTTTKSEQQINEMNK